jgi:hypothetical protein
MSVNGNLDVAMQVASAPNLEVTQECDNARRPNKSGDWRKPPVAHSECKGLPVLLRDDWDRDNPPLGYGGSGRHGV